MTKSRAVFLSHASQDLEAARRICEALRAAGIEVWFDQSELRGGDAWDHEIRRKIHDCALFIAVISHNTQARLEGYFRREWKHAVHRTDDMAEGKPFLVPVVIDDTPEQEAHVPEKFRELQWTHLRGGATPDSFCRRIAALVDGEPSGPAAPAAGTRVEQVRPPLRAPRWIYGAGAALALGAVLVLWQPWRLMTAPAPTTSRGSPAVTGADATPGAAAVPDQSVAVLPFIDMSEKRDQEYFSDGLSEELIDLLAKIPTLRVPARTSSFYFKGKTEDIATIAARLRVAHVLEGSVRKSGERLRVTAQLIRADSGYHLWSETYDRKWDDVFKVQDEIAAAVVKALTVSLLGTPVPQRVETSNTEAYALYLRARFSLRSGSADSYTEAITLAEQSARLDPGYAPTWALLARALMGRFQDFRLGSFAEMRPAALRAAREAVKLDPKLSDAHMALGRALMMDWDFIGADGEMQAALALDSSNPDVLRNTSYLSRSLGRLEEAVRRVRAASELDPLDNNNFLQLGLSQWYLGNFAAAESGFQKTLSLQPDAYGLHGSMALLRVAEERPDLALAEIRLESDPAIREITLPQVLSASGRTREAVESLVQAEARYGEKYPGLIAIQHAARHDMPNAMKWWEHAFRQHDTDLQWLKTAPADALWPQLAAQPEFKALLRRLNLPE